MTELTISLDLHSKTPLYEQIYDYIRDEIRKRQILPGERLPSSRALSSYLQVSRSTVELAYEQLVSEGYLESVPYRGYLSVRWKSYTILRECSRSGRRFRWRESQPGDGTLQSAESHRTDSRIMPGKKSPGKCSTMRLRNYFSWEIPRGSRG